MPAQASSATTSGTQHRAPEAEPPIAVDEMRLSEVWSGEVVLLPAQLGPCTLVPSGSVEVVEIALPEADERANE